MKIACKKALLSAALVCMLQPGIGRAEEGIISFNKAPAEVIVEVTDGIVDATLAQAIVDYREKNGPFKSSEDLRNVPGMTSLIFGMLGPIDEGGDVLYEAEIPTGMHSY